MLNMGDITNAQKWKYLKDSKEAVVKQRNVACTKRKPDGKIQFTDT